MERADSSFPVLPVLLEMFVVIGTGAWAVEAADLERMEIGASLVEGVGGEN